jgi:hypothetical protein
MIEARNEAGQIQFDASSFSFYLVETGLLTLQEYYDPDTEDQEGNIIPGSFRYCSAGVITENYWDYVFYQSPAPIVGTFVPAPGVERNVYVSTPDFGPNYHGASIRYYCFRSTRFLTPQPNGVGMEIYNADGSVAYSSSRKPLILLAAQKFTSKAEFKPPAALNGGSGGLAVCVLGTAYSDSNPPDINGYPDTTVTLGVIGGGDPYPMRTNGFKTRPIGEKFRGAILFADTTGLLD